ncbi:hypothetical protein LZ30DRAFT_211985 [Colletotrichum cereale]|nr:hypothetical protein LZ30DRAFT_211985 [Colletotrichum cereale]
MTSRRPSHLSASDFSLVSLSLGDFGHPTSLVLLPCAASSRQRARRAGKKPRVSGRSQSSTPLEVGPPEEQLMPARSPHTSSETWSMGGGGGGGGRKAKLPQESRTSEYGVAGGVGFPPSTVAASGVDWLVGVVGLACISMRDDAFDLDRIRELGAGRGSRSFTPLSSRMEGGGGVLDVRLVRMG